MFVRVFVKFCETSIFDISQTRPSIRASPCNAQVPLLEDRQEKMQRWLQEGEGSLVGAQGGPGAKAVFWWIGSKRIRFMAEWKS